MNEVEEWLHAQDPKVQVLYDLLVEQNITNAKSTNLSFFRNQVVRDIWRAFTQIGVGHCLDTKRFKDVNDPLIDMFMFGLLSLQEEFLVSPGIGYTNGPASAYPHATKAFRHIDNEIQYKNPAEITYIHWNGTHPDLIWYDDAKWKFDQIGRFIGHELRYKFIFKKVKSPLWSL
jgi:hypothetical protein